MQQVTTTYFEAANEASTELVLEVARRRAQELGIKTIVVASTSGATGVKAAQAFQGYRLVVVSHVTGHKAPNIQELTLENRARIEALGGIIVTAHHTLGGLGRAVRRKLNTYQMDEIVAYALRTLGQGVKVACEIATMAADAGLARTDQDIIAIAGTDGGCDTAVVIRPANTQDFFDLKIREILCKPRL